MMEDVEKGCVGGAEKCVRVGDWIRFYQAGRLVIGKVEYISVSDLGRETVCTDIGCVSNSWDLIREVRR